MRLNIKGNQKGFSLIELMVVVAIIGVLATVAVPNYMRFQSKAKQANAKSELSGIYGAEKAFYAEYDSYTEDLVKVGYLPDGIPVDTGGCPVLSSQTGWPTRFYATGFTAITTVVGTAPSPTCGTTGAATTPNYDAKLPNSSAAASFVGSLTSLAANQSAFAAGAYGKISGNNNHDVWNINENKQLINTTPGL